jgi:hypothetical protein
MTIGQITKRKGSEEDRRKGKRQIYMANEETQF